MSHDTRALHFHWTKQTHRTADVIVLLLFSFGGFQETKKKNVDLFWRLAIFQIFFLYLKNCQIRPFLLRSVTEAATSRWREEEEETEHVSNLLVLFSKQCCESYELWFCPDFVVHMWGNFAKCENILTSATPRPVRCLTIMSINRKWFLLVGRAPEKIEFWLLCFWLLLLLLWWLLLLLLLYHHCDHDYSHNHFKVYCFAMYFLFWDFYFSFLFIIKGKMN